MHFELKLWCATGLQEALESRLLLDVGVLTFFHACSYLWTGQGRWCQGWQEW